MMILNQWGILFAKMHAMMINVRRLHENGEPVSEDQSRHLLDGFKVYHANLQPLGLKNSLIYLERMIEDWDSQGFSTVADGQRFALLHERIVDELESHYWLYLPYDKAKLYGRKSPFGQSVDDAYPSAGGDIEAAARCLAVGEGTATVFHLMRVMEVALKSLARPLGIPYAPSWESYLKQISKNISDPHNKKTAKWIKWEPFFRDLSGDLQSIKQAWRNPTIHVARSFNEREAEEIFSAVKAFMQNLASRLPEKSRLNLMAE